MCMYGALFHEANPSTYWVGASCETETVPPIFNTVDCGGWWLSSIHNLLVRTLPGQATGSFLLFSISPHHQFGTHVTSPGSSLFPLLPHTTHCVFNLCWVKMCLILPIDALNVQGWPAISMHVSHGEHSCMFIIFLSPVALTSHNGLEVDSTPLGM